MYYFPSFQRGLESSVLNTRTSSLSSWLLFSECVFRILLSVDPMKVRLEYILWSLLKIPHIRSEQQSE